MRCLILGAVLGVILAAVSVGGEDATTITPLPTLTFSNKDIDIILYENSQVNLTLSFMPEECINITFTLDKEVCEDVDPILNICPTNTNDMPLVWVIPLNSTNNGKAVFKAKVSPEDVVDDEDAFIRLGVMITPAINTAGDVLGWIYTIAWDISFLPQLYRNWKRKNVEGLAFDFLAFNFIGFFSYLMYNIGNLWIPEIEIEFNERNPTSVMHVRINDVIFPLYALLCTILQLVQCAFYERAPGQRISMTCRIISSVLVTSEVIVLIIVASSDVLEWLDLLLWFSYVKICITCVKYIPQLYMNYKVKSTEGWSIWQVILDCTGGTLSLVQMFMLAANFDDWHSVLTDPAKLGLGLLSIFFNIFFFMQHYCLYRGAKINENVITPMKSFDSEEKSSRKSSVSSKGSKSLKGIDNPDPEAHM